MYIVCQNQGKIPSELEIYLHVYSCETVSQFRIKINRIIRCSKEKETPGSHA